jgi:hypothetical protein
MQHCDQTCTHCARDWFRWLKSREHQMSMPHKGAQATFAAAAATSVRPASPAVGARVRVQSFNYPHTAVVVHNTDGVGLDGRRWVKVAVTTTGMTEPWEVHVEHKDLVDDVQREGGN